MNAPFSTVRGLAVPLLVDNLDTDTIIRIEHLLDGGRGDLRPHAFEMLRRRADGSPDPTCALNAPDLADAPILLGGRNFGCGSSREPAVWAIRSLGVRVVVAESFGDIFANNCCQNGLLAVRLPHDTLEALAVEADARRPLMVDLGETRIMTSDGRSFAFTIDAWQRQRLLAGGDELTLLLRERAAIDAWQSADRAARPWIWSRDA